MRVPLLKSLHEKEEKTTTTKKAKDMKKHHINLDPKLLGENLILLLFRPSPQTPQKSTHIHTCPSTKAVSGR